MRDERTEAKFLRQAQRSPKSWRLQRNLAVGLSLGLAGVAATSLWQAAHSSVGEGFGATLLWLALAGACCMWAIHAELMEGAAIHVARNLRPQP